MADSFTLIDSLQAESSPPAAAGSRLKVLVTGAAGRIGSAFAEHGADRYDLRLMVFEDDDTSEVEAHGEVVHGDVTDLDSVRRACEGVDTVLHLAGDPSPSATWEAVRATNIDGTYHTMVAAKAAGCRRVIFASSIHAVSGYPVDRQVMAEDPVNPGDVYGVSKCFGEAMGRYMAEQQGLSVIAVRICAFQPHEAAHDEKSLPMLDAYVSPRDLCQLFDLCIADTKLRFAIVHGLSDNTFKRLDLAETRELLGYHPQDDLTKLNPRLARLGLDRASREHDEDGDASKSGIREDLAKLER